MKSAKSRIALLSNVNMNFVIRMLSKEAEVYQAEGYGNELGILMNPRSSYYAFAPEITFLVMDLAEVVEHDFEPENARVKIDSWFAMLSKALQSEQTYYISDGYLWAEELKAVQDTGRKLKMEMLWQEALEKLCAEHGNVRILPYRGLVEAMGAETAFSMKMWYMGKILLSNQAQKSLCDEILYHVNLEKNTPKKVLLLDLDNTLWGGLAGEADHTPVVLSEDHSGLAYKNLQRVILQMQRQGVLLAVVSKNNEEDAKEIIESHPHMVLRSDDFVAMKMNWKPKHENIQEIAAQLNLGVDSFVFFDDNPTERQLVKEMLPGVTVPDFPEKPEELAPAMAEIYRTYFAKTALTAEDLEKTKQYADNARRSELQQAAGSFEDYLRQLHIVAERVDACKNAERLTQLVNKTNQFNLTTKRYTPNEMAEVLRDSDRGVYLYRVEDKFGDNGIVAAVIVKKAGTKAEVEEFAMSCRVMGKNIEFALMDHVEEDLRRSGVETVTGMYLPTAKNKPVEELYSVMGYKKVCELSEGGAAYELNLSDRPKRTYYVQFM